LKLVRMFRIFKTYQYIPNLALHSRAMLGAVRPVGYMLVFVILTMYFLGLLLVNWCRSYPHVLQQAPNFFFVFGSLNAAIRSLLQVMMVDDAFVIINRTIGLSWHVGVLLIVFFALATMLFYNILIGAICRAVGENKARHEILRAENELRSVLDVHPPIDTIGLDSLSAIFAQNIFPDRQLLDWARIQSTISLMQPDGGNAVRVSEFLMTYGQLSLPINPQDVCLSLVGIDTLYHSINESIT
jgi:hypothetical protein